MFRATLYAKFDEYLALIRSVDFDGTTILFWSAEITRVENFIGAIKHAIDLYLRGDPFHAYDEFKKAVDATNIIPTLESNYGLYKDFYRLRENNSNFPLAKGELFH